MQFKLTIIIYNHQDYAAFHFRLHLQDVHPRVNPNVIAKIILELT